MKHEFIAAAIVAMAFIAPTFAQDKSATESPKGDAPKTQSQTNKPSKRHTHMEDRQGIKPADGSAKKSEGRDKSKHFHPKDK